MRSIGRYKLNSCYKGKEMKFNKQAWEKRTSPLVMTRALVDMLIRPFFQDKSLVSFETINNGLANTNVVFTVQDEPAQFVLRIYTRNTQVLALEQKLSDKLKDRIAMPEFLYVNHDIKYPYAIQPWIEGRHLYELFDLPESKLKTMAANVAHALTVISSESFPKAGFFKENFEIEPFDNTSNHHPFVSYIEDCLTTGPAGRRLSPELKTALWEFVEKNKDYFPKLEPSCLVHGDFNFDNILIDEKTLEVKGILDWEFAFSGSYLFDIGTLLRFESPVIFGKTFIERYVDEKNITLDPEWQHMIKVQDLSNLMGLLNCPEERPNLANDVIALIKETLTS